MPDTGKRRGNARRVIIISCSAAIAGLSVLLMFHEHMGRGLSIAAGYAILLLSAVLMNTLLRRSAADTRRMVLLVFLLSILVIVISSIFIILFRNGGEIENASEERQEIIIETPELGMDDVIRDEYEIAQKEDDDTYSEENDITLTETLPGTDNQSDDGTATESGMVSSVLSSEANSTEPLPAEETSPEPQSENVDAIVRKDAVSYESVSEAEDTTVDEAVLLSDAGSKECADNLSDIPSSDDSLSSESEEISCSGTESVPSAPSLFSIISAVDMGSLPVGGMPAEDVSSASTSEQADETENAAASAAEDNFFADFFVQGRDDIALEDGIYYMNLSINGSYVGTIETLVTDNHAAISRDGFYSYVYGSVEDMLVDSICSLDEPYLPLDYIGSFGIGTSFDPAGYEIKIEFSASDMPVQVLSIRGSGRRQVFRPITGGMMLDPAVFVLRTKWELSARAGSFRYSPSDMLGFTFSSDNSGRIGTVYFDFNYSFAFTSHDFDFRMGSYRFYKDFEDEMIRLSWGNVSPDVLTPIGRSFGVRFDRSYSYAGPDVLRKSHLEKMLLIEKSSEVIIYNEGREIFRRTLEPGNYRLRDFVLYTGANTITIRIEPLDGSEPAEQTVDIMYSSSLLAPGEIYYGASFVSGREVARYIRGTFSIPFGDEYVSYDWRNVVLSAYLEAGITHSLTMHTALALQNYPVRGMEWNPRVKLNTELTHANVLGTTRYNLNVGEYMGSDGRMESPRVYARIGHQVSTGWTPVSSLNLSFTYSNPEENRRDDRHRFSLSGGLSGRLGFMSWSTTASGTLYTDIPDDFTWSVSGTMSFSLSRYFWLSASMTLSGYGDHEPGVYGRVYATLRFGKGSATVSTDFHGISASAGVYSGPHSFSASASTYDPSERDTYRASADYSYTGKWLDFSFGADSYAGFRDGSADFSVSTTSVFADGMFAVGSYIPENFLLIRQYGALKGNDITAGSAGSSASEVLDSSFGTSVYTGLSTGRGSAFSLYSTEEDSFSGPAIFDVNVPPSGEYGYVLRLRADDRYSVSGTVMLPDGSAWRNGSSPLYRYSENAGGAELEKSEMYLFTDGTGRFVLSDLSEGLYAFDVDYDGEWFLAVFSVEETEEGSAWMQIVDQSGISSDDVPSPYAGIIRYTSGGVLSGDEFWAMLYPEEAV